VNVAIVEIVATDVIVVIEVIVVQLDHHAEQSNQSLIHQLSMLKELQVNRHQRSNHVVLAMTIDHQDNKVIVNKVTVTKEVIKEVDNNEVETLDKKRSH
jgi:hypothetical protein